MKEYTILLSCIEYNATVWGEHVEFKTTQPPIDISFTLARPMDIKHRSNGIWYFIHTDADGHLEHSGIPFSHLSQAYTWCCEMFGGDFEPYKEDMKTK